MPTDATVLAAVLAGAAVLSGRLPTAAGLRLRELEPAAPRRARARRGPSPGAWAAAAAGLLGWALTGLPGGLVVAGVATVVLRRRAGARAAAREAGERVAAVAAATVLAAELRAGRAPAAALREAASFATGRTGRRLEVAAAAEAVGGDPAEVLAAATGPAAGELRLLGACWGVSVRTGAGLVEAVERLAASLRARAELEEEVTAALTAPRATARLLAALPLLGLGLGLLLGAAPVRFLLGTPAGWGCLAAGVALDLAGLAVTDRLVRRAVRRAGFGPSPC